MRRLLVVLVLAFSELAQAQSTYNVSRIALYSSVAVDIATTERIMRLGGREMNPIAGQNPYRRNGIAIGGTIVVDLLTRHLRKGNPKLATALNFIASSVHFGAAVHNVGVARNIQLRRQ